MPKRPVLSFLPASFSTSPVAAPTAPVAASVAASASASAPVAETVRPQDHREPGSAPRWRVGVGAVVVVVLALLAFGIVVSAVTSASEAHATDVGDGTPAGSSLGGATSAPNALPGTGAVPSEQAAGSVFVHILGQVIRPGLYEIDAGARAIDVVSAAGGFSPSADRAALNLARPVVDGEQIVVPKPGETPPPTAGAPTGGSGGAAGSAGSPTGAPVDLNTADATTLETLPGVGPATAQAILDWRAENGRFASVDDLLDVTGIGDKKLEAVRDAVTVG